MIRIIFIILTVLFLNPVYAEKDKISLKECINTALQNHPSLMVSIEERKKAIFNYKIVRAKSGIEVGGSIRTVEYQKASASPTGFNVPGKDTDFGVFAGVTARYPLYDSSKQKSKESARLLIDSSKYDTKVLENQVVYNVKKSYYDCILAGLNLRLREKLLENFKNKERQAKILYENGMKTILEVTSAAVGFGEAKLDFEKAKNNERSMKSQLFSSLGIKEKARFEIYTDIVDKLPELKHALNDLYKLSSLYNPDLRKAKIQKLVSKNIIEVNKAKHIPKVDVTFAFGVENRILFSKETGKNFGERLNSENWDPSFSAGLTASLPIYTGGAISAAVDISHADYTKMVYNERKIKMDVRSRIQNLYKNISKFSRQFELLRLIIKNANKHLLLAQRSYENGIGSQLTLHNAEMSLFKSELDYMKSRIDYLMTLAELSKIVGIGENYLCKK